MGELIEVHRIDVVLMDVEPSVCGWCGDTAAGVRHAVQARALVRVWQALVSQGIERQRVSDMYAALLWEFAPDTATQIGVEFSMASRRVVAELVERCESSVCEHCGLDAGAIEAECLRPAIARVLVEPLKYGSDLLAVVRTMLVRMKELRPELVRCATGEQLGAVLGYKEGARRAGVSAAAHRVLNEPIEQVTAHDTRFGRQKTPGMRERCARAQRGNTNRAAGAAKAMVLRVLAMMKQ